jgi:hypothetical protein
MKSFQFALMVAVAVSISTAPASAQAERDSVVDVEVGGGYVIGSGSEDPGPSVRAYDLGIAIWPSEHWGFAVRQVRGPGQDLYRTPITSSDRTFYGPERLIYRAYTVRHRARVIGPGIGLEVGLGLMAGGYFSDLEYLYRQQQYVHVKTGPFGGFALDAFATKKVLGVFGVKGGFTYDFNGETNNFQPVVLAAIGF